MIHMDDATEVDNEYVQSRPDIPEGAIINGLFSLICFIDPETGEEAWTKHVHWQGSRPSLIGYLECAKLEVIMDTPQLVPGLSDEEDDEPD